MKILKWILIVIVAIVAIFLIYSASQPNQMILEESIEVEASASSVFGEVINFPSWGNWSAWDKMDPDMKKEFSEEFGVVGSFSAWESENPNVGAGRQEVVEIRENEYMKVEMTFRDWGDAVNYASFTLVEEDGKTNVTWAYEGAETPFYMNFFNSLMEPMVRESYKSSLESLKELVESKSTEVDNPMNLEVEEVEGRDIISIMDSTTAEGIGAKLGELYTELSVYLASEEGAESAGMPLALYHAYSEDRVVLEAAIPYSGAVEASGRIEVKQTPAGKVIKGIHKGDYNASGRMHEAIEEYMHASGMKFREACWEVYANDPTTVDSAEVETHIYYPVE